MLTKYNHRIYGRVIEYGQEWFVLPKEVKETLLSAAKDELNVDKATGKGQMVTFLSNARKAEELNIRVGNSCHIPMTFYLHYNHIRRSCGTGGTMTSSATSSSSTMRRSSGPLERRRPSGNSTTPTTPGQSGCTTTDQSSATHTSATT